MKKRRFKWRILIYLLLIITSFEFTYNSLIKFKLATSNEEFIKCLMADNNYHLLYNENKKNIISKIVNYIINIKKPVTILENTFNFKQTSNLNYVKNYNKQITQKPNVLIYNSHQAEEYQSGNLKKYNINPGVMMASFLLRDKLLENNISSIVLEDNLIEYMNLNNMKHSQSYKASRFFVSKIINDNPSLKLIIDLHRDSISKDRVTTNINGKQCSKILFIIGKEYNTYNQNKAYAEKLNNKIKEKYPTLTRNIMLKGGINNNGIYNQDLNNKMILMEIGSNYSNIDEVNNTISLISPIIGEFVHENN